VAASHPKPGRQGWRQALPIGPMARWAISVSRGARMGLNWPQAEPAGSRCEAVLGEPSGDGLGRGGGLDPAERSTATLAVLDVSVKHRGRGSRAHRTVVTGLGSPRRHATPVCARCAHRTRRPGRASSALSGASVQWALASITMWNGVWAATRKWPSPPSASVWRSASGPACAPSAMPCRWQRALGVQSAVEAA